MKRSSLIGLASVAAVLVAAFAVHARFKSDLARASALAAQGSTLIDTHCGPIEVQQAGAGIPLLMIHGSGGGQLLVGHDEQVQAERLKLLVTATKP